MLPKTSDGPFDSDEYVFEPNWGGRRALAFIDPAAAPGHARLRLLDENGRDLAPRLPELSVLADLVADAPAILDGEIVIPSREGHMDDYALADRLAEGGPAEGRLPDASASGMGPVFLAVDLLWIAGRPLLAEPLVKRRERLAKCVSPNAGLVVLPGVVGDGVDLYRAVSQQGLHGVMARHLRSPYLPGRCSDLWRWIPAQAGELGLHVVADPVPAAPTTRPVLALIQRLPLDD